VAAVVVIFVASYFFHDLMSRRGEHLAEKQVEIEADNEVLKLLDEAEAFYASRINEMKELVFQYAMDNPGIEEELELELSQLDSVYTELRKDLKDNAANEQVVEAMIQNYRIKLEILEDILHQLKKNEENMNVETHEI